jgi:hypothetical protein
MPYSVVKKGGQYCLKTKSTGSIKKGRCHSSKSKAQKQKRAILASEHGWKPKKKPKK